MQDITLVWHVNIKNIAIFKKFEKKFKNAIEIRSSNIKWEQFIVYSY